MTLPLYAAIDALTAEVAERDKEIERLKRSNALRGRIIDIYCEELLPSVMKSADEAKAEAGRLKAELAAEKETYRCFHCGFVAATRAEAEVHFGDESGLPPLCVEWETMDDSERVHAYQQMEIELDETREREMKAGTELGAARDRIKFLEDTYGKNVMVMSLDAYNTLVERAEGREFAKAAPNPNNPEMEIDIGHIAMPPKETKTVYVLSEEEKAAFDEYMRQNHPKKLGQDIPMSPPPCEKAIRQAAEEEPK